MHIVVIGSQQIVFMYKYLHPTASKPFNFWSTTRLIIWVINDNGLSRSNDFGQHLTPYTSVHYFLIYLAQLPRLSSSSSVSVISMTYHKQFSTSQLCAPGLCSEVCSCMHDCMQSKGCHSFSFALCCDCCIYESYDITELYFVSEFWLQLSFNCLTWEWRAGQYHVHWSSVNESWSLEHWHILSDPCTCIDELSCLTMWSLKSSKWWHVAK